MRIVCPSCSAAYDVADSLLTPGRTVRCARCGGEWVARKVEAPLVNVEAPLVTVEAPLVREPEPEELPPDLPEEQDLESRRLTAMDRLAQPTPPRSSGGAAWQVAWLAIIVVILGLLWGAYAWRADVMADWPQSAHLYSLLGLAAPQH
jgi:predicted Zn finger-like uncharacterized protein